jgi:hypothetical protein
MPSVVKSQPHGGKDADFNTLGHTIVYRSPYLVAPGSAFTGCKAMGMSRVNGSFDEIKYEKQVFPAEGVRQLFSSSHGGKKRRRGLIYKYLIIKKINHPHPGPPPSGGRE